MKSRIFDCDIDVKSKVDKTKYGIRGMVYNEDAEKVLPHPSAYYLEDVPTDPITGNASFDYIYGDEKGFMKVDLLTNTSYDKFHSKEEVINSLNTVPNWSLLEDKEFVETMPHLSGNFDIVSKIKPRSVDDLADVLALMRPGKRHLIDQYMESKETARKNLYKRSSNDMMYFKRSHAISYACMIVCLMNNSTGSSVFGW